MIGKRRREQSPITKLVKGWPCEIRISGVCCGDPETTVPCHYRLAGLSGMGFIPPAFMIAAGCFACHQWVDTHHDSDTRLAHANGVFRTLAKLKEMGVAL
jgi:hypothetical protein